jgi:type VI secretion system protein ImpA
VERLDRIEAAIRRADAVFTTNAAGEPSPNYAPTYETLSMLKRAVRAFITGADAAGEEAEDATGANGGSSYSSGGGAGGRLSGKVDSREDVLTALDAIGDYYRRREPGSPVPIVLQRARAWVNADFLSVLKDIAPEALDPVRAVLARREDLDSDGYS